MDPNQHQNPNLQPTVPPVQPEPISPTPLQPAAASPVPPTPPLNQPVSSATPPLQPAVPTAFPAQPNLPPVNTPPHSSKKLIILLVSIIGGLVVVAAIAAAIYFSFFYVSRQDYQDINTTVKEIDSGSRELSSSSNALNDITTDNTTTDTSEQVTDQLDKAQSKLDSINKNVQKLSTLRAERNQDVKKATQAFQDRFKTIYGTTSDIYSSVKKFVPSVTTCSKAFGGAADQDALNAALDSCLSGLKATSTLSDSDVEAYRQSFITAITDIKTALNQATTDPANSSAALTKIDQASANMEDASTKFEKAIDKKNSNVVDEPTFKKLQSVISDRLK